MSRVISKALGTGGQKQGCGGCDGDHTRMVHHLPHLLGFKISPEC